LKGSLPTELAMLTGLSYLNLCMYLDDYYGWIILIIVSYKSFFPMWCPDQNSLHSCIPTAIGELTNLQEIELGAYRARSKIIICGIDRLLAV
jgi:hypothetical protein